MKKVPEHIGEEIFIRIAENSYDQSYIEVKRTIDGVSFDFTEHTKFWNAKNIILNDADATTLHNLYDRTRFMVSSKSVKNLKGFLKDLASKFVVVNTAYDKLQQEIEKDFGFFKFTFIILSVILSIVMILFVLNTISVGIMNRTKEIGILKALGAKNKDLFNIYFYRSVFAIDYNIIFSLGISFAVAAFLNFACMGPYDYVFKIFFVNVWTIAVSFIISFVYIFTATLLPLLKLRKIKPINAIVQNFQRSL